MRIDHSSQTEHVKYLEKQINDLQQHLQQELSQRQLQVKDLQEQLNRQIDGMHARLTLIEVLHNQKEDITKNQESLLSAAKSAAETHQLSLELLINRIFKDHARGFYIDIGVAQTIQDSVINSLYNVGWRGMNIEAVRHSFNILSQHRAEDINLNIAISENECEVDMWEIKDSEFYSFDQTFAWSYAKNQKKLLHKRKIRLKTLHSVCQEHHITTCDLLKINAANHNLLKVFRGIDFEKLNIKLIQINAVESLIQLYNNSDWASVLEAADFSLLFNNQNHQLYVSNTFKKTLISANDSVLNDLIELSQSQLKDRQLEYGKIIYNQQKETIDLLLKLIDRLKKFYPNIIYNPTTYLKNLLSALKKNLRFLKIGRSIRGSILAKWGPKLGQLVHHQPRALKLPRHYHKKPVLKKYPQISIVTPSFNQGHFIEDTILSVLNQSYPNLEYIVQDGFSSDNTAEILKKYQSQLTHWESKKDKGQTNAINLGYRHANGEIMGYLNSDDLLLPGSLHYVADYFHKHRKVDVVYGHRILINENNKEIGRWVLPQHDNEVMRWADYIPQETLFWRKSAWEKIGACLNEDFRFAMDWELILRFIESGVKIVRLPRFLGAFRVHANQKTSANINEIGVKEMEILRERFLGKSVTQREIRKNIRKYLLKHMFYHRLHQIGLLKY